jgi:FMN phosphatase YigB (HAD superfamily)
MLIYEKLSSSQLERLQQQLLDILGVTYDAWATTHHSRFVVPAEFAQIAGVPRIIGDTTTQYCNEPALLVERILDYKPILRSSGCTNPLVLHHYLTHRSENGHSSSFLHDLAAKLRCGVIPNGAELFEKVVMLERKHLALFPDVHSTLPIIAGKYSVSLASNLCQLSANDMMNVAVVEAMGDSELPASVRSFGSYFQEKVFSFEEGQTKPDLFSAIERRTGIPLNRQLMIGDNPYADILGALKAGYRFAVLIDRNMDPQRFQHLNLPDDVIYVTSMDQFRQLLPRCTSSGIVPA